MIFEIEMICNSLLCVGALFGFVYSLIKFFKPKKALYNKMVGCALGCMFIERLYRIVQFFVAGGIPLGFQIGAFGTIGCYMFLFTANYGSMDSLIDDGSAELKKYRRIALAAPLTALVAATAMLFMAAPIERRITCAIEELFVGASAYYSLKHLIIPTKFADFLSGMRPFHIISLIMAAGTTLECIIMCDLSDIQALWCISSALLLIALLSLAPVLERGTKQWRT